jgi:hypothetical protein
VHNVITAMPFSADVNTLTTLSSVCLVSDDAVAVRDANGRRILIDAGTSFRLKRICRWRGQA